MVRVRVYEPGDASFVLGLAPRLTVGIPPWRDPARMLSTVQDWLRSSIARRGERAELFVAVTETGELLGFASVSEETHFTGTPQAYLGELAVVEEVEGSGVGTALVRACEGWARRHGVRILALATGAGNERARAFYHRLGFLEEDVKLVKVLDDATADENRP